MGRGGGGGREGEGGRGKEGGDGVGVDRFGDTAGSDQLIKGCFSFVARACSCCTSTAVAAVDP